MVPIFMQALTRILRVKATILYIVTVSVTAMVWLYLSPEVFSGSPMLDTKQAGILNQFQVIIYYWVSGLPLILWISYYGAGLLLDEIKQGTLLLLVSKPLARSKIIISKVLALIITACIIALTSLFIVLSLLTLLFGLDSDLVALLLSQVPYLGLYIVQVVLSLSFLSVALSVIFKRRALSMITAFMMMFMLYLSCSITMIPLWIFVLLMLILSVGLLITALRYFSRVDIN